MRIGKIEIVAFCIVLFGAFFVFARHVVPNFKDQTASAATATEQLATSTDASAFSNVHLEAKAAYVYDVNDNKVLFAQDASQVLPLASLTKLMMALTATETYPPSTTITISQAALDQDGDNGLLLGERWNLKDLLDFTLVVSSNDGAYAIAQAMGADGTTTPFIAAMNSEAQELGLSSMLFYNPNGLDLDATTSGGYGSAQDVAKLFNYILTNQPNLLEATAYQSLSFTSLNGIRHMAVNTDDLVNIVPDLIASKTGYTDLAGGNLVIGYDAGIDYPIIIVVLGSTEDSRFTDVQQLVSASLADITGDYASSTPDEAPFPTTPATQVTQ